MQQPLLELYWRNWLLYSLQGKKNTCLNNVKTAVKGSRIADHAWSHSHDTDFHNVSFIDKDNYCVERFWNPATVWKHLMRTITLAFSRGNKVFFLTKILNEIFLNFYSILFNCIFITLLFRFFHFQIISPTEDSSSGDRKLVFIWTFLARNVFNILIWWSLLGPAIFS